MFLELFRALVKYFSPLNVFKYLTFRSAYAAVTALLIAFLFGPMIIEKLRRLKFGQSVRTDGPESHLVKSGTPHDGRHTHHRGGVGWASYSGRTCRTATCGWPSAP